MPLLKCPKYGDSSFTHLVTTAVLVWFEAMKLTSLVYQFRLTLGLIWYFCAEMGLCKLLFVIYETEKILCHQLNFISYL